MDKRRRTGCPAGTEQKINGGATLDSLRTDLAEKEKAAADAEGKKLQILLKLSITLDTLTARILKLSSDSQSRIEPVPLYSRRKPTDCRADPAVAPVAHEISPDHRF